MVINLPTIIDPELMAATTFACPVRISMMV